MDIYNKIESLIYRPLSDLERIRLKKNYRIEFKNNSLYLVNIFNNKVVKLDNRMVTDKSVYEKNAKHLMYSIYVDGFKEVVNEYNELEVIKSLTHKISNYIEHNIATEYVGGVSVNGNVVNLKIPNNITVTLELKRVYGIENFLILIEYNKGLSTFKFKDYIHVHIENDVITYYDNNKLFKIIDLIYDQQFYINILLRKLIQLDTLDNVKKLRELGYKMIMEIGNNFTGNRFSDFIYLPNGNFFKEEKLLLKYINNLDKNNDINLYLYKKEGRFYIYSYTVYTSYINEPVLLDDFNIHTLQKLITITEKERSRKVNLINDFNNKNMV